MNNYWKDRKILITGGGGFIGSNAVEFFLKKDAIISATVSPHTSSKIIKKKLGNSIKKINLIEVDLLDKKTVQKITEGMDTIMNFAAIDGGIKFKMENSLEIYKKNLSITKILIDAAIKAKIKSFLLLSSIDIYPTDIEGKISENRATNFKWDPKKEGYKLAKWESEQYAIEAAKKSDLNIIIVRPANIYGPGDNFEDISKMRFIPSLIRNIYLKKQPIEIWGDGSEIKSFLYVDDFLNICKLLIEKGITNIPINVASKNLISIKELAKKIISLSKSDIEIITNPQNSLKQKKRIIDITLLEQCIGPIRETEIEKGIKNTIDYFINLNK